MINCKNLFDNFVTKKKETKPSIAFQLLALEPFLNDKFSDLQTDILIKEAMTLDEESKVLIATEAYQKADDNYQPIEDQIYYSLIAICCCFYLKNTIISQKNKQKIKSLLEMAEKYNSYTIKTFLKADNVTSCNQEYGILTC